MNDSIIEENFNKKAKITTKNKENLQKIQNIQLLLCGFKNLLKNLQQKIEKKAKIISLSF